MGKIRWQRELCAGTLVTSIDENHGEIKDCPHSETVINASYKSCENRWCTAQLMTSLYTHTRAYRYKHTSTYTCHEVTTGNGDTKEHPTGTVDEAPGHAAPTTDEVRMPLQCDLHVVHGGPLGMVLHKGTAMVHSEAPTSKSLRPSVVESVPART